MKKMSPLICGYLLVLVAQYAVITAPVGAPETIELFHPEMPPAPARSPANKKEAVPVIHLDTDANGKASVDAFLKMFPQDLLTSNKIIQPIGIHKIEYEDYIDYEIEFVELSEDIHDGEEVLSSSYVNNLGSDEQSSIMLSSSSSELSEDSQEINLVTFVDLLRRARIRHKSKISSDKWRRRRIKLKRDPFRNISTDTNDSSNHIDTVQNLKRKENILSKTNTLSKLRELIRNKSPPETNRNSGNRRITLPRYNSFRRRRRFPIKRGKKISQENSPIHQLMKLRNPQITAKLGRSTTERTQKMTTSTSADNSYTNTINEEDPDKSIVVTRNVTSKRFVTSASSFPILTSTTAFVEQTTENNLDDKLVSRSENIVRSKLYPDMATTKKLDLSETTIGMENLTATAFQSLTTNNNIHTTKSNESLKITTRTTTMKPTTEASIISTTLMKYPEVFTVHRETVQESEDSIPIKTISLPFSLLSLFGGMPKSSRLEIAPPSASTYNITKSFGRQEEGENGNGGKSINGIQNKEKSFVFSPSKNTLTSAKQLPQVTTVTSSSQFSIISTSTQTSIPLHEHTTTHKIVDELLVMEKNNSSSIEPYTGNMETIEINKGGKLLSSTERSLISTTIALPTSVLNSEIDHSDLSRTTSSPDWMKTALKNEDMTNTNNMQNEYKYQEFMISTKIEPIPDDSRPFSTPNNTTAGLPADLQLSESITTVYLHNHPMSYTITNNVGTTENPKTETVNSITLMPYSRLVNHRQETGKESTTAQSITENIFTVTPQYISSTSPNTKKTTSAMQETTTNRENKMVQFETFHPTTQSADIPLETLFSGQYHEISPCQYHEVSPGQYPEHNPSQYEEVYPRQYDELHPSQPGQYHNFEKSYSGDYEVNDVKVDFDHQDEHKIYNVQATAGDFIIGEVGRIDVNNGQTLEGVRYTALEGEVDPLRISQILERFFGTRTS